MQVIECYELQTWNGGSGYDFAAFVKDEASAQEWKQKHKMDRIVKRLIVVYDDVADLEANNKKELRKRALAKLTPEERDALGLDA